MYMDGVYVYMDSVYVYMDSVYGWGICVYISWRLAEFLGLDLKS